MTQYKEIIHNIHTGEVIERPFTEKEIAEVEANIAQGKAQAEALAAKAAARQEILDRLGLTADEAALLLGAN